MSLADYTARMLPAIEAELRRQVSRLDTPGIRPFHDMLAYHMGWDGLETGRASGKRIRPLMLLLVHEACGGQRLRAVSAAAAIELIHNFSLIHDDIEDHSSTRRGRQTLWAKHGGPVSINAGDAMFVIAQQALLDTRSLFPPDVTLRVAGELQDACLSLTRGQFLDMSYEGRNDLTVQDYWPMVEGKTAALLQASTRIGAILAGAAEDVVTEFASFGRNLGLAFQVQDDILGIWGDESETGKSAASDLVEGKRSLPVLYGLTKNSVFANRWAASRITQHETQAIAQQLRAEGAESYCAEQARELTAAALKALDAAGPSGPASQALTEIADKLLGRKS